MFVSQLKAIMGDIAKNKHLVFQKAIIMALKLACLCYTRIVISPIVGFLKPAKWIVHKFRMTETINHRTNQPIHKVEFIEKIAPIALCIARKHFLRFLCKLVEDRHASSSFLTWRYNQDRKLWSEISITQIAEEHWFVWLQANGISKHKTCVCIFIYKW